MHPVAASSPVSAPTQAQYPAVAILVLLSLTTAAADAMRAWRGLAVAEEGPAVAAAMTDGTWGMWCAWPAIGRCTLDGSDDDTLEAAVSSPHLHSPLGTLHMRGPHMLCKDSTHQPQKMQILLP